MISAKIICDSISPEGQRLTTFELRYPKFIHGEFMTHRVFSRNASSSRAIPTKKYLEEVRSDELRAGPIYWGKNQAGMQAAEELIGDDAESAREIWRDAARWSAIFAGRLAEIGVHKQIVNRIMEPFLHINVVVTATEYMNFFGLRLDGGAQPEIRALAVEMWKAYTTTPPRLLKPGEWHLPYVDDSEEFETGLADQATSDAMTQSRILDTSIKVSVARCARVSYRSFETGKLSIIEEDLKLYDRLLGSQPIHASPAEHQATPDKLHRGWNDIEGRHDPFKPSTWDNPKEHGNFKGWRQYRQMLPNQAVAPLPKEFQKLKLEG